MSWGGIRLSEEMLAVVPDTVWDDFFTSPDLDKERNIVKQCVKHLIWEDQILWNHIEESQDTLADMLGVSVSTVCRRLQALQEKLIAIQACKCKVPKKAWKDALLEVHEQSPEKASLLNDYAKHLSKRLAALHSGWAVTTAHHAIDEVVESLNPDIGQLLAYCLEHRVPLRTCLQEDICQQEDQASIVRRTANKS